MLVRGERVLRDEDGAAEELTHVSTSVRKPRANARARVYIDGVGLPLRLRIRVPRAVEHSKRTWRGLAYSASWRPSERSSLQTRMYA